MNLSPINRGQFLAEKNRFTIDVSVEVNGPRNCITIRVEDFSYRVILNFQPSDWQ